MKKTLLSLAIILGSTLMLTAQKFEGKITYSIEYEEVPEAIEPYISMLPKESKITIKGTKSKAEQSMGGMGTSSVISDSKEGSSLMLISMMGKKAAVKMTKEEIEAEKENAPKSKTTITKETKVIAGYKCTKATVKTEDESEMTVWYTTEIPALAGANNKTGADIPGFPMEYTVNGGNDMVMTMSVSKVEKAKVANSEFEIPEGYEEMTMEEFQNSMPANMGM
jgi:GLPGLI family protein